jgi:hypothetical protein
MKSTRGWSYELQCSELSEDDYKLDYSQIMSLNY